MGIIRTLLAISVLITHSDTLWGVRLLSGDVAVTCFFIISGFLMALIMTEKYRSKRQFFVNRLLRIYPLYMVVLFLSVLVCLLYPAFSHNPFSFFGSISGGAPLLVVVWSIFSNLFLFGTDLTRYLAFTPEHGFVFPNFIYGGGSGGQNLLFVPQAWTLSLELYFYLLVPYVVRLRTTVLVAITALFFGFRIFVCHEIRKHGYPIDESAIFPMQVQYFLVGVLAYRAHIFFRAYRTFTVVNRITAYMVLAAACAVLFFVMPILSVQKRWVFDVFYLGFAFSLPFLFRVSSGRFSVVDRMIGDYSYPVYVFHFLIARILFAFPWVAESGRYGELTLLVTVVCAAIYLYCVDVHVQRFRAFVARQS